MAGHAKARETLFALREQIAILEGRAMPTLAAERQADAAENPRARGLPDEARLPFGIEELDNALEGGLPMDAITEIRSGAMHNGGAASGFAMTLAAFLKAKNKKRQPLLWIGDPLANQEFGRLYAIGLLQFGIGPQDILYASPRRLDDAMWIAETAVASGALSATILEIRGNPARFGLGESRRLNLRAKSAGRPLLLLRHAAGEEASSAPFRFLATTAPASLRPLPDGSALSGSIGNPIFRLLLEKSRNPAPLSFLLEWNAHERQFLLGHDAAELRAGRQSKPHSGTRLPASADRSDRPSPVGSVLAFQGKTRGSSPDHLRRPA